ncbi:hypothetical protein J2D73_16635 [Acetobacter sacchari]|uniref:Uncharacterized protein n=1 Tax=Acetobacter sacchari TaxID=2661687 RepID=A0ABS3LZV6_9PROT|nr:hypothetical protein [Acetobacter sacchari]MBO1361413.1 hypothetical protein [Acetobacter sacchari]
MTDKKTLTDAEKAEIKRDASARMIARARSWLQDSKVKKSLRETAPVRVVMRQAS